MSIAFSPYSEKILPSFAAIFCDFCIARKNPGRNRIRSLSGIISRKNHHTFGADSAVIELTAEIYLSVSLAGEDVKFGAEPCLVLEGKGERGDSFPVHIGKSVAKHRRVSRVIHMKIFVAVAVDHLMS